MHSCTSETPLANENVSPLFTWGMTEEQEMEKREHKKATSTASLRFKSLPKTGRLFPTKILFPEHDKCVWDYPSKLFELAEFTWAPHRIVMDPLHCTSCTSINLKCKEYLKRDAVDVACNVRIFYIRYACKDCEHTFTTIGDEFFAKNVVLIWESFPFFITPRYIFSKEFLRLAHDAIMWQSVQAALKWATNARYERYHKMVSLLFLYVFVSMLQFI